MKIHLVEPSQKSDITQLVQRIVWSGDEKQAARRLELEIVDSPDENIPKVNLSPGNMLKLTDDQGAELFTGYIFFQERSGAGHTARVTAYDGLVYLLKSKATYNFKKTTAEAIAAKVAKDFNIAVGEVIKTGIIQNLVVNAQSPYEVITQAYSTAGKQTGNKYRLEMNNSKLFVLEKGKIVASLTLGSHLNITEATYSENIENMINRVLIYNNRGESIGKVEEPEWLKTYGVLQDVYQKEEGSDPNTVARSMLKGLERSGNISALGNTECRTGVSVKILEPFTGLSGLFEISTDCHTWQEGKHIMELGLNFTGLDGKKEG